MTKSIVYKSAEISVETELDGEIALMNIDSGDFFALKDTALQIWRRIDGVADQVRLFVNCAPNMMSSMTPVPFRLGNSATACCRQG